MNKTTRRIKALLTAVALGVCCAYAQTSTPAGFILPDADPDAAPYDFHMSKTDDGMSVSLTLNRIDRTITDSVAGTCRVSVPGLSSTTFAGLPALPYKAFRIAPEGSGTPQIIVRDSTYIDIPVNLDHNPRIEYDSIGQPHQIAVAHVDYTGFMPSDLARVTDTQTYRDRPIYTITVMPMKYDRATGVLRIFTSLDIDIAYTVQAQTQSAAGVTRSPTFNAYTDRVLTETLGEQAVAFSTDRQVATMGTDEIIGTLPGTIEPLDPVLLVDDTEDMLVLSCTLDFHEATDSLVEWKQNLGYRVHVVERNWDWTQAKVDNTIRHYYNTLPNLTTVIIMGTNGAIPGYSIKERFPNDGWIPRPGEPERKDSPTDYPYMCLDSSNDRFPDVAYGRILASCKSNAIEAVSKIIKYEKGLYTRPDIYSKAFLATAYWNNPEFHNGRFIPTLEDIHDILDGNGISAQRLYTVDYGDYPRRWDYYWDGDSTDMPDYLQPPLLQWDATAQDVKNAFEAGVNLAVYNGHGGDDRWVAFPFTDEDCRHLSFNDSAPLIFSIACSTANHTYSNCIIAELSRRMSGGIAAIASSNLTYLGFSDALLLGMIDAIWPNTYTYKGWKDPVQRKPVYRLYEIMSQGHSRTELVQGGGYWDTTNWQKNPYYLRYQRENFHVYGDPTINYNTVLPTPFTGVEYSPNSKYIKVTVPASENETKIVVKKLETNEFFTCKVAPSSTPTTRKLNATINDSLEIVISGPNKIPYYITGIPDPEDFGISLSVDEITEVLYDQNTQTATVKYTTAALFSKPTFSIHTFSETRMATVIAEDSGVCALDLRNVPNGVCIISMIIDGKIVSTYKLIKQ